MVTTTPQGPDQARILLGIAFMMLAASLFPVMNGLVQWLSQRYASEQVIWARITGHFVLMVALMLPARGLLVLATRRPALQFGRSACQLASTTCYFTAIATVPLAKATAIGFIGPFLVALIAWPLLGERLQLRRMLIVLAGFLGVVLVIRPGMEGFQPAALLVVASSCFYAMYQVLTRKVARQDSAETSALWSALLGAVATTALVPFFWTTPATLADALAFLSLGALGAAGHWCVARALALGPAAVIAPFQYWQIVGATLAGVVVTGLWPDGFTWAGSAIVVAAGVVMAVSEGRRR